MSRPFRAVAVAGESFPRVSGDEPEAQHEHHRSRPFSPRERG